MMKRTILVSMFISLGIYACGKSDKSDTSTPPSSNSVGSNGNVRASGNQDSKSTTNDYKSPQNKTTNVKSSQYSLGDSRILATLDRVHSGILASSMTADMKKIKLYYTLPDANQTSASSVVDVGRSSIESTQLNTGICSGQWTDNTSHCLKLNFTGFPRKFFVERKDETTGVVTVIDSRQYTSSDMLGLSSSGPVFDKVANQLYFTDLTINSVVQLVATDLTGKILKVLPLKSLPRSPSNLVSINGKLMVINGNRLSSIDVNTGSLTTIADLPFQSNGNSVSIVSDLKRGELYVSLLDTNTKEMTLLVVQADTGRVLATLKHKKFPNHSAKLIGADDGVIYYAHKDDYKLLVTKLSVIRN
jgi:hypothetical protein